MNVKLSLLDQDIFRRQDCSSGQQDQPRKPSSICPILARWGILLTLPGRCSFVAQSPLTSTLFFRRRTCRSFLARALILSTSPRLVR